MEISTAISELPSVDFSQELQSINARWDRIGFANACRAIVSIRARFLSLLGSEYEFLQMVEATLASRIGIVRKMLKDFDNGNGSKSDSGQNLPDKLAQQDISTEPFKTPKTIGMPDLAKNELIELSYEWEDIETQVRIGKLVTAYNIFMGNNGSKEDFISEAANILKHDRNSISVMVDIIIQQQKVATATAIGYVTAMPRNGLSTESLPEPAKKDADEKRQRGRKPLPENVVVLNEDGLPNINKRTALQKSEVAAVYKNLQIKWREVPAINRAKLIRASYNHECKFKLAGGKAEAFARVCAKLSFLDEETITGYIAIAYIRPEDEAEYERVFPQGVVRAIGDMKKTLGDSFDVRNIYGELKTAARYAKNLTKRGFLKASVVEDIRRDLKAENKLQECFSPDKKYRINTDVKEAVSAHKGILDETLQFIPETNPAYDEWKNRLSPAYGKILFQGRGYYFIDPKFVCEASQISPDGFADMDDEEDED